MNQALLSLLVLGLALTSTTSGVDVSKKVLKKMAVHHMFKSCWGEQNMKEWYKMLKTSVDKCQGLTPTFNIDLFDEASATPSGPIGFDRNTNNNNNNNNNLNINNPYEAWMAFLQFQQSQQNGRRYTRAAKKTHSAADIADFKMDVMMFKEHKIQNLGNLTCVLADLGALDSNLNINLNHFTRDMWSMLIEQPDPEFKAKLIENFEDCYAIAQSVPQAILDKHPFYKKFGRNKIFFKCHFKAEINLCTKQEISRYYEDMYGPVSPQMLKDLGLPEDKFDAAYMKKKVKYMNMADSEKFVYKVMMGLKD